MNQQIQEFTATDPKTNKTVSLYYKTKKEAKMKNKRLVDFVIIGIKR